MASDGATPGATTPTEQARERSPEPTAGEPAASEQTPGATVPDGAKSADGSAAQPAKPVNSKPTARVRNRLIVAVAVVAAAIAGAGAPAVVAASGQLSDAQELVTLAERTQQAVSLSHSLADERDEVTSYIAAGRPKGGKGLSESRSARVDRQIDELRSADAPAGLRRDLADIAAVRRAALTGKSSALEAHTAYSDVITELHALTRELAEQTPPRAGSGGYALADLDHAVEQAAATRGLLLAALAVPRTTETSTTVDPVTGLPTKVVDESSAGAKTRNALSAAAQRADVREQAAVADFRDTATERARATYDSTVTGTEVTTAEKYLSRLTDQPTLSTAELRYDSKKIDAALSARIEMMRGAESSLTVKRTKDLAQLRDDDVTALEIRVALIGVTLLVAVGVTMAMARTLTRPLAVLRLGSARLATEPAPQEPIRFTGRDDEFAQVVRSVNALHGHAAALTERLTTLEADRKHLIGQRTSMADERATLRAELAEAAAHLERVRQSIHGTFVNLALRTLGLVERQLAVIENLEDREQDPDRLATLFKLDHFATVMRRHSENLLVLAGAEHGHQHPGPVPLVDVVRAAVSEIERYERVRIATLPPHAHVAGFAADDISHLVAELLENATSFSPPDASVEVSGWLLESGEVMLSVQDEGIGVTPDRMTELNSRLAEFRPDDAYDQESGDGLGLGLYVVARLAARHGARVRLREQKQGGVAAVVVLPKSILAAAPAVAAPPAGVPVAGAAPVVHLPGSEAEANSNVLPGRSSSAADPLIAAAEVAVQEAEAEPAVSAETTLELVPPEAPEEPEAEAEQEAAPAPEAPAGPKWERVTDKGLPKRTPKITAPESTVPKARSGSVDAEALRKRLGGFHQGAISGRRDVEAELSERNEETENKGDSVEEASS
ncbi:nitrate- and nitrite sensing domain-containing protein [Streptomyces sp. NBC_01381]|uniref:sensor histidine kinase n=1 Tax=Streptomyces sp. NBC_01381 TaxID=2903845 RepID=UPI00225A4005|nr:nitrate- and nitrite sensing domain-containing protein [Streptomyces sp. NBC_01381]MCX4669913.1 nitrate- and nitrite sensing domain-containing protein [Streptomyces sp. NBC_01381]